MSAHFVSSRGTVRHTSARFHRLVAKETVFKAKEKETVFKAKEEIVQ